VSQESISVVLPLKDAQTWLLRETEKLLECLADFVVPFEVILIDNGSTDYTAEVIDDLRRSYPQVRGLRMQNPCNASEAVQKGVSQAAGELIFVQELSEPIRISDLMKLWALRTDKSLVMARAQTSARRVDEQWVQRLMQWGKKISETWGESPNRYSGLQMLRRSGIKALGRQIPNGQLEMAHFSHQSIAPPKYVETTGRKTSRLMSRT
jgi:glycosyltransferase involved in cell wall biosynthesis